MPLLLIDDRGEIWSGESRQLRNSYDSPFSGSEFSDYAVANLGFVALNVFGSACQVRLRPAFVGEATCQSLRQWLVRSQAQRVVLTWLDANWQSELLKAGGGCVERLDAIIAAALKAPTSNFISRPVTLSELPASSPVRQIIESWGQLKLAAGQQELMKLLEQAFGNRYVVLRPDHEQGTIKYAEVGAGLFPQYETWRSCAIGAPVEETPDRGMGRWAVSRYRAALDNGAPLLEDVDGIVQWPHAGRGRLRYRRLIVPLASADGTTSLVGASLRNNAIDLRVGRG